MTTPALNAKCVATTGESFSETVEDARVDSPYTRRHRANSNFIRQAQFSSDGTTIVTHSEDQCLKTFVLPVDLLDDTKQPHGLSAHCISSSPSNIRSYALYPRFNLQDPSTTVGLVAAKDLPMRLTNVLHNNVIHATYPLIKPGTEAYIVPNSVAWSRDGGHFVAGSKDMISFFDSSYDGSGPFLRHKTAPGKQERKRFGSESLQSCRGIFTGFGISSDGVLAAGTTEREVTLYANEGNGECITSFSLAPHLGRQDLPGGTGITQCAWSPCGTYLFIAERQTNAIQVYDIRRTISRVCWLNGREARTTQRLGFDVVPTADGCEVWAGGTDGCVRMWKNPGAHAEEQPPDEVLQLHEEPVSSAVWHPGGAVLATCAGLRFDKSQLDLEHEEDDAYSDAYSNEDSAREQGNTLKIWTV